MDDELQSPVPSASEPNFMAAAEIAIRALQDQAEQQQKQIAETRNELAKAQKAARWRKIQVRILGIVSVVLIVACSLGIVQFFHVRSVANKVQQGSIAQCEASNDTRAAESQVWDHILSEFLTGTPSQATMEFVQQAENFVATKLAPHDCSQVFGASS